MAEEQTTEQATGTPKRTDPRTVIIEGRKVYPIEVVIAGNGNRSRVTIDGRHIVARSLRIDVAAHMMTTMTLETYANILDQPPIVIRGHFMPDTETIDPAQALAEGDIQRSGVAPGPIARLLAAAEGAHHEGCGALFGNKGAMRCGLCHALARLKGETIE